MIELEKVSFAYADQGPSVQDVSFRLEKGEFAAILGANGAGKTTTVRLMDGLLKPTSGRVLIDGVDTPKSQVSERAGKVGFLFQNPDRQICKNTVREEILFGLRTVRGKEGEDALHRGICTKKGDAKKGEIENILSVGLLGRRKVG